MSSIDFELDLSHEEREIQETVHRFAEEVLRPVGAQLDKMEPEAVIDTGSPLWQVFDQYDELGVGGLNFADEELPPAVQARIQAIVLEELAWGDSGIALSLACRGMMAPWATMTGQEDLIERCCTPGSKEVGCWAITEPDHGSDTLATTEPAYSDPAVKANCIAKRDGDEYVIQGQKSSWVSNGPIATVAALFCTIEGDKGFDGGGVAVVPMELAGVSKGKPLDKLGQRALPQGEIFFDEVRIPAGYMLADQDTYTDTLNMQLTLANAFMGVSFSGVARSAFDLANAYATERVQGGRPIREHQSVKLRLFDMYRKVETASAFARKVFVYNQASERPQLHYSIAAKTYCTQVAFDVASMAVQIFGGNGLSREYPVEKIMRDARASMIEDGCNEVLSIVGASNL
ncbi:MAG: acyl-CoA/acyl-ACP dehydrogenase [Pseudomonadales bacterium]|nr:acyl-CoA/acyl-ACP dehydrogenase [Pseudomonadales bacterium]